MTGHIKFIMDQPLNKRWTYTSNTCPPGLKEIVGRLLSLKYVTHSIIFTYGMIIYKPLNLITRLCKLIGLQYLYLILKILNSYVSEIRFWHKECVIKKTFLFNKFDILHLIFFDLIGIAMILI